MQPSPDHHPPSADAIPAHVREMVTRLMLRFQQDTRRASRLAGSGWCYDTTDGPRQDRAYRHWLRQASGMALSRLDRMPAEAADFSIVPLAQGRHRLCVALRRHDDTLDIVLADPFDRVTRLWLESRLRDAGHPLTRWFVTTVTDLHSFYRQVELESMSRPLGPVFGTCPSPCALESGEDADPELTHYLDQLLLLARQRQAGSLHIHWHGQQAGLRLRVGGLLQPLGFAEAGLQPPAGFDQRGLAHAMSVRLQRLAGLDETSRLPGSGHIRLLIADQEQRLRLSRLPLSDGEDLALHLQSSSDLPRFAPRGFDSLELPEQATSFLLRACEHPRGLLLLTGLTGSGKSTTLRTLADHLALTQGHLKHISLVEHALRDSAHAIDVCLAPGQDPAALLRAVLEHDPDRLLIDLPRHGALLQAAARAAAERLPVQITLTARDAFDAISQMTACGVPAELVANALNGVLAQRLLRQGCPHCTRPADPDASHPQGHWLQATGCERCHGTGYLGRRVLTQWLPVDAEWRQLIAAGAGATQLRALGRERGINSFYRDAVALACSGITTMEEVQRVTTVDE